MISNMDIPASLTGKQADRLDITKAAPKYDGHFLSIIAFDGHITAETVQSITVAQYEEMKRTGGRRPMWRGWKFHTGEGQVRSRNECAHIFLQSPCMFHDFNDADVLSRPDHWYNLRRHPEAKESIICGLYCKKQDRIAHPYNSLKGGNPAPNAAGLMEVSKGATGFMQIPRYAYERIMEKFPERFYLCDYDIDDKGVRAKKFSFFFHDIRPDQEFGFMRDQSEDWAFCELARAAGVKIYVDVSTTTWETQEKSPLLHKGSTLFPLRTEIERMDLENQLCELQKKYSDDMAAMQAKIDELAKT